MHCLVLLRWDHDGGMYIGDEMIINVVVLCFVRFCIEIDEERAWEIQLKKEHSPLVHQLCTKKALHCTALRYKNLTSSFVVFSNCLLYTFFTTFQMMCTCALHTQPFCKYAHFTYYVIKKWMRRGKSCQCGQD